MNQELLPWTEAAHRLRSIERHLKEFRDAVPEELGLSLGNMALADNLDWLDCLADALERGTVELRSSPDLATVEREALMDVAASLAAAISLLERSPKKAAPSDKMFDQMLADYRKSLDRARATIRGWK